MKYLPIPGTSVSPEHIFSEAGQVTNAGCNRLSPDKLDEILLLHNKL